MYITALTVIITKKRSKVKRIGYLIGTSERQIYKVIHKVSHHVSVNCVTAMWLPNFFHFGTLL